MSEQLTVDVCVVGAGYAGLLAARDVARADKDVCVLEARDRVGGRIWTVERAGRRIDVGGAWIAPMHDQVRGLAREFGIELHKTHAAGDTVYVSGTDVSRFRGVVPRLSPIALGSLALGMARLDMMAKKVPIDAPWETRRAHQWDAQSAGAWIDRNAAPGAGRELLAAGVRGLMTCDPSEVSLLHFLYLVKSAGSLNTLLAIEGGYQDSLVVGGAGSMAEAVAAELGARVRLGSPVREIAQSDGGVRVVSDGVEVLASRVIVAIPPALVANIAITPSLPLARAQLIERMPAGSITKFVVLYEDAFWRVDGLAGTAITLGGPIEMTIDAAEPSGSPGVITAFAFGPHSTALAELSADARRKIVLDTLTTNFGARAATPVDFVEQERASEQWSRGCFMAHMAPGVMTQFGRIIREPCGRIHWAGTETATKSHGAIDGAIRSGHRAASEALAALA
jgi:monoamine oxidase